MSGGLEWGITAPDATDGSPVVVLLHGRGADRRDLEAVAPHLPMGTALVTPQAPHPGRPWGYGPGWAWYRYIAEDRVVPETLAASLEGLEDFLLELPDHLGFQPGPLVLGGFSQGGTTSLAFAITHPDLLDGVVVLSGFLADAPGVVPGSASELATHLSGTPVFWGHGTDDPAIPHALGQRGRERLRTAGVALTARDYPIGHGIVQEELDDLAAWLEGL